MSSFWLCQRKTSNCLYLLIAVVIHAMTSYSHSIEQTNFSFTSRSNVASATTQPQRAQTYSKDPHNDLMDDLGHEEFTDHDSNLPHSRRKRLIWVTDDGRLALPPGTSLTFTPTIALPLVRHPPEGFFSNLTISFPVTIDFDKLGLTDNQNPLGDLPPIFARSFGHTAGEMLGQYVYRYLHYRRKRDLTEEVDFAENVGDTENDYETVKAVPELPERFKHIFHGGERVMLYGVLEDFLSTFGMNGKACLLRTICEVHSKNLDRFGVFGEMAKLFLTVTKSPFSDLIPEYVNAQEIGEGRRAPGECFPYHKRCPKSVFKTLQKHKYRNNQGNEHHKQEVHEVINQGSERHEQDSEDIKTNKIQQQSTREQFLM